MTSPPTSLPPPSVDLYAQALKSLAERCPFDTEEFASRSPNLPFSVAARLLKHPGGRKKFKKPSSSSHGDQAPVPDAALARVSKQSSSWWEEMEVYFRTITESDIECLRPRVLDDSCFLIPLYGGLEREVKKDVVFSGNEVGVSSSLEEKEKVVGFSLNEVGGSSDLVRQREQKTSTLPVSDTVVEEEGEEEEDGLGLNWVLGSKLRAILTTQRPTKKRKLLGSDAGLDQLLALPHSEEGSIFCDVCCLGEFKGTSNKIITCDSCSLLVHKKCYGLQGNVEEPWVCYRCKHLETGVKYCLLCPKEVGALKLVGGNCKNDRDMKFAHLFCSIWTPEVYVEDTCAMEPVVNVWGVPEMRKRLVCNVCKVKHGACVRCSFGTCRTAFHPICARDARYQMEIWAKFGCENVELRAFCSKHSTAQDVGGGQHSKNPTRTFGDDISVVKPLSAAPLINKLPKLRLSCKSKEKNFTQTVMTSSVPNDAVKNETLPEQDACAPSPEGSDMQSSKNIDLGVSEGDNNSPDISNLIKLVRKLIGRGDLIVGDVASEMGISSDSLQAALMGEILSFPFELRLKMMKWFQESIYVPASSRNLKFRNGTAISTGSLAARVDCPNATDVTGLESLDIQGSIEVADSDNPDACSFKSLSLHRRILNKAEVLKEENAVFSPGEKLHQSSNGELVDATDQVAVVRTNVTKEDTIDDDRSQCTDEVFLEMAAEDTCPSPISSPQALPPEVEVNSVTLEKNELSDAQQHPDCTVESVLPKKLDAEEANIPSDDAAEKKRSGGLCSSSYVHPYIQKRLMRIWKGKLFKPEGKESNSNGHSEDRMLSSDLCNHNLVSPIGTDLDRVLDRRQLEQMAKAKEMRILEFSPADEIEGEMLYLQNNLLDNALEIDHNFENLLGRVVKKLPQELSAMKKQQWDLVFVNQFLREVKEAKKRGRKERKHREAQVVLAAAAAAAATSSRLRKDGNNDIGSPHPENPQKVSPLPGRAAGHSPLGPRLKETTRSGVVKYSPDKNSGIFHLPDFSKEKALSCDICRRSETLLSRIFVCSSCKVAVHLDCYRKLKDPIGPWKCELCEEMSQSTSPRNQTVDRERPWLVTECALCGGGSGAFRKATNGQWVHAFCAEWLLESTFRRGQQNLVDQMDILSKEKNLLTCCICHQTFGVCSKCSYGHCQVAFHPYCARAAGFYMNTKTVGGRFHHKAYCEKHSMEQRQKADDQQHGAEQLKSIKQIRFELEKVRILCERIVKREKIKRDLVLCSHDILASKKDCSAYSIHTRRPYLRPGVSSESATTSIDNKSYSETIQRSEDITVDSTVSGKRSIKLSLDMDRKTDDSSISQPSFKRKIADRTSCSGKQLPHGAQSFSFHHLANDGEKRFKTRKPTETFNKEVVMTSRQASMQNRRLPKGFVYVPVDSLSNEKPVVHDSESHEPEEPGG